MPPLSLALAICRCRPAPTPSAAAALLNASLPKGVREKESERVREGRQLGAQAVCDINRFNEVQQAERERERQRQQRQSRLWLGDGHTFLGAAAPPLAEHPDQAGLMLERFNVLNARQ